MAAAASIHAGRGDGRALRASERGRDKANRMCSMTTRERQTVASMALMPNARPWRRGQSPQPRSGAPQAQGLTAAITVAAPSNVPFFAFKSTSVDRSIGISDTTAIYTTLTDVTGGQTA